MRAMLLGLLALAGSIVLPAQTGNRLEADVPFAFEMADKKLPAGEYRINEACLAGCMKVHSRKELAGAFAMRSSVLNYGPNEGTQLQLVFNKYGDRYFLAEIWTPTLAQQLMKSKSERALVTSKLITAVPERVIILARAF